MAGFIRGENAELVPVQPGGVPGSVANVISIIFNTLIVVGVGVFVLLILIGGIQYLTAAGNEEGTAKAKRMLIDAVIGLVIVLAAYAIGTWVLGRFGI